MTGTAFGGIGTRPSVSGSAGISLSRFTIVSVDSGITPIGNATLLPSGPYPVKGSDLFDFGIAFQGRIPVKRWEPYILLDPSLLVNSYLAREPTESGRVDWRGNRHSRFGLQGGAGVRYYIKSKWGVRAEYRYISSVKDFSEIKAGVFYQVEGYSGFHFRNESNRLIKHLTDRNQRRRPTPSASTR
jgi:opacity protein-like surface antigen